MFSRLFLSGLSVLLLAGSTTGAPKKTFQVPRLVETLSFAGDTLYTPPLKESQFRGRQMKHMKAEKRWEKNPDDAELLIWTGRRLGYLGRFQEAIAVYTKGMESHPDLPHLYRHRGHRFITTHQLDKAIGDLDKARELMNGMELEVEQDGLPNKENTPTTTLQFNVWYHLGLANYLKGDFKKAEAAYRSCLAVSNNDDSKVSSSYWLYITLKRLGRDNEAAVVLDAISGELALLESENYHDLLLLFQGNRDVDAYVEKLGLKDLADATIAYGASCCLEFLDRRQDAVDLRQRIVAMDGWAAFGYIAAEADLYRDKHSLEFIDETSFLKK